MKSRQFKLSAISVTFELAFGSVATFAGEVPAQATHRLSVLRIRPMAPQPTGTIA